MTAEPVGQQLFALNYGKRPAEELYDLRKDPDEVKNVADDPAYAEQKKNLSERLLRIMRQTKDPRLTDAFDRPPYYQGPSDDKRESGSEQKINNVMDRIPIASTTSAASIERFGILTGVKPVTL